MAARILLAVAIVSVLAGRSWAQAVPGERGDRGAAARLRVARPPARRPIAGARSGPDPPPPTCPRRPIARVTSGSGSLPNQHGQIWREYDISPYTARVTTTKRPEQAIVDWILRETGYEVWHREPLGILSAHAADAARLSHAGNAGPRGRRGRSLRRQRGAKARPSASA